MRRLSIVFLFLLATVPVFAQQEYVGRFDVSSGFSYLAEPKINLAERGVNLQGGVNVTRWLTLGADWNYWWGHSTIFPNQLTTANQQALGQGLQQFWTANPQFFGQPVFVPFDSNTWSFAAGPQLNIRKFSKVTLFVRPVVGVMHEVVTLKPTNESSTFATGALLGNTNKKADTTTFYGFGGGFDLKFSKHVALRAQSDFVHVFLFEGTLKDSRNASRVSIGPAFNWGGNVK